MVQENYSRKTAISRSKPSRPMRYLDEKYGFKWNDTLDYGCGKGHDADTFGLAKYDPFHFPDKEVLRLRYGMITCNYVLNVIPDADERAVVLRIVRSLLRDGGSAYISVRDDTQNLNGYTKLGTWQGYIELPELGDPIRHDKGAYRMYEIYKPFKK